MRDPKRIDNILRVLERIWKKNPDLRLTQLLGNCFEENDLYYVEDVILERALRFNYEARMKETNKGKLYDWVQSDGRGPHTGSDNVFEETGEK